MVSHLKQHDFNAEKISIAQIYSFSILAQDTIQFNTPYPQHKIIDSIVKKSFYQTIDSLKKIDLLKKLVSNSLVFLQVIVLNNNEEKIHFEKVPVTAFEETFLGVYDPFFTNEYFIKMVYPFFFRLPIEEKLKNHFH